MVSELSHSAHWYGDSNKVRDPTLEVMNLVEWNVERGHLKAILLCVPCGEVTWDLRILRKNEVRQTGRGRAFGKKKQHR